MSALTHLTLLHANDKVSAALRFGFEREGTLVADVQDAEALQDSIEKGSQLIITGGEGKADAEKKLALIEGVLAGATSRVRVLYFGNSISRQEALEGGAHEFLSQPAFIRDVVTLSKLMATPMERRTQSISGELSEHFGLFYLVRALGMIHYTGVLTLLRGLRRGELRFYQGEVTSGQMGSLHGLAALHQSLLWTNARFDLRDEQTVHRRQIPLERAELLRDCERFLTEIRSVAGGISPSAVLERHREKDTSALPKQVLEVLELFDGTSSVADVIEDSPYRVFETLRIACRLAEQGFVHRANKDAPKHLMHTALAIEEWLVSGAVETATTSEEAMPLGPAKGKPASPPQKGRKKKRGSRKKRRSDPAAPSPVAASSSSASSPASRHEQSWSDLLPTHQANSEMAQVVPSTDAVGEFSSRPSSRASRVGGTEPPPMPERERLEEKGGVESLAKIFVDESLGAEALEAEGKSASAGDTGSDAETAGSNSWDVKTSPAVPQSMPSNIETGPIVNPSPGRAAAKVESAPPADEAEAKLEAEAPALEPRAPKLPKVAKGATEADLAVVATTASDAVLAIAAVLQAAASDASVLEAPAKSASKARADSKSDKDAQDVQELASAAEAAGTEASHFSVEEEAFFDRGHAQAKAPPVQIETFDDLDDGYEIPRTFWQRFLSNPDMRQRKKKKR